MRVPNEQSFAGVYIIRPVVQAHWPPRLAPMLPPIEERIGQQRSSKTLQQYTGLFQAQVVDRLTRDYKIACRDWSAELWAAFVLQQLWLHAAREDD